MDDIHPSKDRSGAILWSACAVLLICCGTILFLIMRSKGESSVEAYSAQPVAVAPTKETPTTPSAPETATEVVPAVPAKTPFERFLSNTVRANGKRFKVPQGEGTRMMQQIIDHVPKSEFVDLISMYKTMEGIDGSTTTEALEIVKSRYIGKYYMLQGDVFQIQADRDYPREGLNGFTVFGQVRFLANYAIPVNVACSSAQKIPPYLDAPILTKIEDFSVGTNRAGKRIIIPIVKVVAVTSFSPCCGYPEDVIINEY
jgi:hypothetical protein